MAQPAAIIHHSLPYLYSALLNPPKLHRTGYFIPCISSAIFLDLLQQCLKLCPKDMYEGAIYFLATPVNFEKFFYLVYMVSYAFKRN